MPPAAPAQNSQQALGNLQQFTQGMQSPQAAMGAANNQFDITGQQQQVQGLRTAVQNTNQLLNQVAPSVMGRTANSLVTQAQANAQIQNQEAPLNAQLNTENQAYGNANQDYQSSLAQAANMGNATLTGQNQEQSYLQGIYNDLYTQENNAAQLASNERVANTNAAASRSSSGATGYGLSTIANGGGLKFHGPNGLPVSLGTYLDAISGGQAGTKDMAQILSQSNSANDQKIGKLIGNMTPEQAQKQYPWLFQ